MGLPAAVAARESGASVILVEAEPHLGGHAYVSGGHVLLGGGTSLQKKYGIVDTPDLLFRDLTDWSVIEPNGVPDYRYNDREIVRAYADSSVPTFEWLVSHGVKFIDKAPNKGGLASGNSAPRLTHVAAMQWPLAQTGKPLDPDVRAKVSRGCGFIGPLEEVARKLGVEILLEHRMIQLHREDQRSGPVTGITVSANGKKLNFRARKAVIIGTGGSTGNVNFRRMFDPRLTDEYCGLAGMPWSNQDASGEIAAMEIGASLWGLFNQSAEFGFTLAKAELVGSQYCYASAQWQPGSPVFNKARASGMRVSDWQNVVQVNMLGHRFFDETAGGFPANSYGDVNPYIHGNYKNAENIKFKTANYINAALAGIGDAHNGGGPIWAIFDAAAVEREEWNTNSPNVDYEGGFFFSAQSIEELADKIKMKHQRVPMPPANLVETVRRYNGFVESGTDSDFGKPHPAYKIAQPPFYAAWSTPVVHDTRAGLRINSNCGVVDLNGEVIPGLYCGGEAAGGFGLHGIARAASQGYIAGRHAAGTKRGA